MSIFASISIIEDPLLSPEIKTQILAWLLWLLWLWGVSKLIGMLWTIARHLYRRLKRGPTR